MSSSRSATLMLAPFPPQMIAPALFYPMSSQKVISNKRSFLVISTYAEYLAYYDGIAHRDYRRRRCTARRDSLSHSRISSPLDMSSSLCLFNLSSFVPQLPYMKEALKDRRNSRCHCYSRYRCSQVSSWSNPPSSCFLMSLSIVLLF